MTGARGSFRRWILSLGVVVGWFMFIPSPAHAAIPAAEREALIALYNSTNGAGWTDRTNWRNAADTDFNDPGTECSWYGVTCTGSNVTTLNLLSNRLNGQIPSELRAFQYLRGLFLWSNRLSGSIPSELGSLLTLEWLHLYSNQLSESIPPEIGNLSNLRSLILHSNRLTGSIPPELGRLSGLRSLDLSANQLSGEIPSELESLSSLVELDLSSNTLEALIPNEIIFRSDPFPPGTAFGTDDISNDAGASSPKAGRSTVVASGGWGGNYYELREASLSWGAAQAEATSLNGYLATVRDEAENSFLAGLVESTGCTNSWLGLAKSGTWGWVTGEPFVYTNWKPGEPSGDGINGNIFSNGGWNDTSGPVGCFFVEVPPPFW
ncbi:MAG: hypothetical protein K8R59_04065 [Thermoanaerobaculales bacterium]|nr:hypothetical protein [Thermoanaerobaculales bacterium]